MSKQSKGTKKGHQESGSTSSGSPTEPLSSSHRSNTIHCNDSMHESEEGFSQSSAPLLVPPYHPPNSFPMHLHPTNPYQQMPPYFHFNPSMAQTYGGGGMPSPKPKNKNAKGSKSASPPNQIPLFIPVPHFDPRLVHPYYHPSLSTRRRYIGPTPHGMVPQLPSHHGDLSSDNSNRDGSPYTEMVNQEPPPIHPNLMMGFSLPSKNEQDDTRTGTDMLQAQPQYGTLPFDRFGSAEEDIDDDFDNGSLSVKRQQGGMYPEGKHLEATSVLRRKRMHQNGSQENSASFPFAVSNGVGRGSDLPVGPHLECHSQRMKNIETHETKQYTLAMDGIIRRGDESQVLGLMQDNVKVAMPHETKKQTLAMDGIIQRRDESHVKDVRPRNGGKLELLSRHTTVAPNETDAERTMNNGGSINREDNSGTLTTQNQKNFTPPRKDKSEGLSRYTVAPNETDIGRRMNRDGIIICGDENQAFGVTQHHIKNVLPPTNGDEVDGFSPYTMVASRETDTGCAMNMIQTKKEQSKKEHFMGDKSNRDLSDDGNRRKEEEITNPDEDCQVIAHNSQRLDKSGDELEQRILPDSQGFCDQNFVQKRKAETDLVLSKKALSDGRCLVKNIHEVWRTGNSSVSYEFQADSRNIVQPNETVHRKEMTGQDKSQIDTSQSRGSMYPEPLVEGSGLEHIISEKEEDVSGLEKIEKRPEGFLPAKAREEREGNKELHILEPTKEYSNLQDTLEGSEVKPTRECSNLQDAVEGSEDKPTKQCSNLQGAGEGSEAKPTKECSNLQNNVEGLEEKPKIQADDNIKGLISCQAVDIHSDDETIIVKKKQTLPLRNLLQTSCIENGNFTYPNAPLGEVWAKQTLNVEAEVVISKMNKSPSINGYEMLLGRHWVWDEGSYTDRNCEIEVEESNVIDDQSLEHSKPLQDPIHKTAYCKCHKQGRVKITSDDPSYNRKLHDVKSLSPTRRRRSERASNGASTRMSDLLAELATGRLNPHTMIKCEDYVAGPEYRFLRKDNLTLAPRTINSTWSPCSTSIRHVSPSSSESEVETDMDTTEKAIALRKLFAVPTYNIHEMQPFAVKTCPDAMFLADLHAHLSASEVIGLLGGRYIPSERCIYIQAAFPCKSASRSRGDSGFTDVEMDPVSQIIAGDAIIRSGMTVVGWYHSHPNFQPDPSVIDIENQANYQSLFQGVNAVASRCAEKGKQKGGGKAGQESSEDDKNETKSSTSSDAEVCPFVGLIVGTYDGKNPTPYSVMRWFHVISKGGGKSSLDHLNDSTLATKKRKVTGVNFPMKLKVTHRKLLKCKVDGTANSRFNRSVLVDKLRRNLAISGPCIRRELDLHALKQSLHSQLSTSALLDEEPNPIDVASRKNCILCDVFKSTEDSQSHDDKASSTKINDKDRERDRNSTMDIIPQASSHLHALASDIFSDQTTVQMIPLSNVRATHFLPYSDNEIQILRLSPATGITDFVRAGIIWKAVEREQKPASRKKERSVQNTPSAACILELLLSQFPDEKDSEADDTIIIHTVDAILFHYAHDSHKINPFSSWSGAGEKGLLKTINPMMTTSGEKESNPSWKTFYEREIMGLAHGQTGPSAGAWKMKRGHKIACCMLGWARNLQINDRNRWKDRNGFDKILDECTYQPRPPNDVEFVSEIMRLLAARWREAVDVKNTDTNKTTRRSVRLPSTKKTTAKNVHVAKELPAKRNRSRPPGKRSLVKVGRSLGKVGRPSGKVGRPPGKVGRPPGKVGRPPGKVGRPPGKVGRPQAKTCSPPRKVGRPPKRKRGRPKHIVPPPRDIL